MTEHDPVAMIAPVRAALDDTEAEYGRMPFFVRPMVRRGFVKRTGHDFEGWRRLLAEVGRGGRPPGIVDALARLAEHYDGAPERAKRGMGARLEELREVEARSQARASAARALATALRATAS